MRRSCWLKGLFIIAVFILGIELYDFALKKIYKFSRPSRVMITWPSDWGCDEFNDAYQIIKIEPSNSFIRQRHKGDSFMVPYPTGRSRDTTKFYRYYADLVKMGNVDTVIISGHFGEIISVGEGGSYGGGGGMYACDPPMPYFKVQNIYSKRGKLLRHFPSKK